MGLTLAEKIIARAAGRPSVRPGEVVTCAVDLAMMHDSGGPRRVAPLLKEIGAPLFDPGRVVLVADHFVPGETQVARDILDRTRQWARDEGVTFYDGEGICHVVLPERGHLAPGMLVVGGDSHSPTGGAFGAYMFGIGSTEMAGVLATGEIWLKVPETIVIAWRGALARGVSAKDIMLALCGRLGMGGGRYQAIQYTGDTIAALSMQERMTLCNMAAELGAQAGLIAPDEATAHAIRDAGGEPGDWRKWQGDDDAGVGEHHVFDAAALEPQVAAPDSPANAAPIADYGHEPMEVAYIGACTGAKYDDLAAAATVLRGRNVSSTIKLLVAPASRRDQDRAASDGIMSILTNAGADILPNACGMCAGYGPSRLGEGVRCVSSTARNFRGRMGARSSRVWLASPYTVAASAVEGRIADPRPYLADEAA